MRSFRHNVLILFLLSCVGSMQAQEWLGEQNIKVSMRMIGHEILLSLGDSTTRILPIEKVEDTYKISFVSPVQFNPDDLVATIDKVVKETNMAKTYLVEVESDSTGGIVYSYRMGEALDIDAVACKTRDLPIDHYNILITILEVQEAIGAFAIKPDDLAEKGTYRAGQENYSLITMLLIPFSLLVGLLIFFWKKGYRFRPDPGAILIGDYLFDRRNMELSRQDEKTELTSKESDLLYLLHSCANATVEREVMLKVVWGDEGDYVGRTLDVFISKLRKKLEADPSVRIANIRGVGYKLILNN